MTIARQGSAPGPGEVACRAKSGPKKAPQMQGVSDLRLISRNLQRCSVKYRGRRCGAAPFDAAAPGKTQS